ncbi:hypothetical protein RMR10_004745 [Agrobacterium rosae]|uniref:hypothetical protein n=1 Tax=Agrobacterium rosae TaxID=1972867 RepID=UPI002A1123D3|nr:hypothetical protein [Agrobacterium rosae]MDX8315569.1 hypothetical protein [Agrobacterium rosae]
MIAFFTGSIIGRALAALLGLLIVFAGFRVWLASHDAKLLSGYVLLSEKTAAESLATEMIRQRNAATQTLEDYRKRATADALTQQKLEAQLEQAIKDDDGPGCTWTKEDMDWLERQRKNLR